MFLGQINNKLLALDRPPTASSWRSFIMNSKEARNKIYLFLKDKGFDLDPNRDELKKLIIEYGEVVNSQPTKIDFNIEKINYYTNTQITRIIGNFKYYLLT